VNLVLGSPARRLRLPRSPGVALAALLALLALLVLASLATGAVELGPGDVLRVLADGLGARASDASDATARAVVLDIRLPRVALAAVVGAGLATAGALMQGLFRNPLADPALLGVSGGAALGAGLVLVVGLGSTGSFGRLAVVPAAACLGGALATAVVLALARRGGRLAVTSMLLAGIAVNAMTGAGTGLLIYAADESALRSLTFWLMGSLGGASWHDVAVVAPAVVVTYISARGLARPLDALLLGASEAGHLGVDVGRLQRHVVLLTALATGASVAVCGIIGFVGLVVPHLVRLALGPGHRRLIPCSALAGAALLVGADLAARTVVAPAELPLGILTALVGAPVFLALLPRGRREGWNAC
jgi:iron complex transport system permease protein